MITTKNTHITPNLYFKILVRISLKRFVRFFALILIIILAFLFLDNNAPFVSIGLIFLIFYLVFSIVYIWRFAYSKDNKIISLKRNYKITKDKLTALMEDDTVSEIKNKHFLFYQEFFDIYLLYISKSHFIPISIDSFKSKKDHEWFKKEILSQIKQKK